MAILYEVQTRREVPVPARLLVGRSPTCVLRVSYPQISSEHAVIEWAESHWTIRDLASRNGTFVNDVRIEPGTDRVIAAGDHIAFGPSNSVWSFEDDAPSGVAAIDLESGAIVEGRNGVLSISGHQSEAALQIFRRSSGEWLMDDGNDVVGAEDRQVVQVGGRAYVLQLPGVIEVTPIADALNVARLRFEFEISSDEEFTRLSLEQDGQRVALEPREHLYVLLNLARIRASHSDRSTAERGWVDRAHLLKMLGMSRNALNVAIHRARQQLADAGVLGAADVVEVRRGLRRFGSDNVRIRALQ